MRKEVKIDMYLTVDCESDGTAVDAANDLIQYLNDLLNHEDITLGEAQLQDIDFGEVVECDVTNVN